MIILYTGLPGAGKTSSVVDALMNDDNLKFYGKEKVPRIRYSEGIPELKLNDVFSIDDDENRTMDTWTEWVNKGDLLIIDEAQRIFRPRSASSQPPKYVSELEKHRHYGIDIILITQHPNLIDAHVRRLIEVHHHIMKTPLGVRKMLTFNGVCNDPTSPSSANLATSNQIVKLKKNTFDFYKSSSLHTNLKVKPHKIIYIAPIVLLLFLYYGYKFYNRFAVKKEIQPTEVTQTIEDAGISLTSDLVTPKEKTDIVRGSEATDYIPVLAGRVETKPLYDNVRQVVNFEYPEVCVSSKDKCTCYSNQATIIEEIPEPFCRKYAANGVFNPYKPALITSSGNVSMSPKNPT